MNKLITPERAKELRRAAARHAGGMILVSLVEWDPTEYFPNEAERDLVLEEVERIGNEIKARALVGTTQRCGECNLPYRVKADGTMHRHTGVTAAGFSTGEPCPGVGKPPASA
ncbi:hypothetical protein [Streptomyces tricolor]